MKIGILGLAGAGKDTFAGMLQAALAARGHAFGTVKYATPIKELTRRAFRMPSTVDLEDRVLKETTLQVDQDRMMIEVYYTLNKVLKFTSDELDLAADLYAEHLAHYTELTPRKFQQILGTEIVRAVDPNAWVNVVKNMDADVIVTDVRFDNELCDYNILVQRFPIRQRPEHTSEHFAWDLQFEDGLHLRYDELHQVLNYPEYTLQDLRVRAEQLAKSIEKKL